jgi:very-short-patch-repair endonuclease
MANKLVRALRKNMTPAERRLWAALRRRSVLGARFRRQQPVGPYVADFTCLEARLIVEVDGGQHAELRRDQDERRDAWLESQDFRVLRFWNRDVFINLPGVLETIADAVREARQLAGDVASLPPCGGAVRAAD